MKISQFPYSESILSVNSIWMAIVMFFNPNIYNTMPKLFEKMSTVFSPNIWGGIFLTAALIKVIGMITKKKVIRKIGLWASALLYGVLAAFFGMASVGINLEAGFCVTLCFMAYRGLRGVDRNGGA